MLIVLSLAAGIVIAGSPIVFEENRGQASREVLFLSRGAGYGVFLTSNRTLIATNDAKLVQISLAGGTEVKPVGVDRLSAKSNYFIGADPASDWLSGCAALDDRGFVLTDRSLAAGDVDGRWEALGRPPLPFETSYPGLFAVGDIRSGSTKRVAAAVGEGSAAVRSVHDYLAFGHPLGA